MLRRFTAIIFILTTIASTLYGCEKVNSYINEFDEDFDKCLSIYKKDLKFPDLVTYQNVVIEKTDDSKFQRITFIAKAKNGYNQDVLSNITCKLAKLDDQDKGLSVLSAYKDDKSFYSLGKEWANYSTNPDDEIKKWKLLEDNIDYIITHSNKIRK